MKADNEYWILRPWDFLPEKLEDTMKLYHAGGTGAWYPNEKIALQELSACGNLFTSAGEAAKASMEVRMTLKRLRSLREEHQALGRLLYKRPDNNQSLSRLFPCLEKLAEGMEDFLSELRLHISQNASDHSHCSSQANGRESSSTKN